ncbi:helix-turn-helix transcriptional regulator [Vibrio alfacsensis]|uniref:helix-turn-helix transcriptional regulator n=1 Tax=Vibrio TaxID=662 RepID=UPI001BEF66A2|nr:helix-turn-helix domain-containing protein [Vibrio alfacsensis]BCN23155.1 hypothetical protein VYA_03470 [Vibrio alfacsensis]
MCPALSILDSQLYLTRKEVAKLLKVSPGTLANWATDGKGPQFVRLEGKVCYPVDELKVYLNQNGLM